MRRLRVHPLPLVFALPLAAACAGAVLIGWYGHLYGVLFRALMSFEPTYRVFLTSEALGESLNPEEPVYQLVAALQPVLAWGMALTAWGAAVGLIGSLIRWRGGLYGVRVGYACLAVGGLVVMVLAWRYTGALGEQVAIHNAAHPDNKVIIEAKPMFLFRFGYIWPGAFTALVAGLLLVLTFHSGVMRAYGIASGRASFADRFFENLRTNGRDPEYRRSGYTVTASHLALLLLPWLLSYVGCHEKMAPYRLPLGEGAPQVVQAQVVQKQVKRKLLLNPQSSVRFDFPELEDSEIEKIIDEETKHQYEADPNAMASALGGGESGEGGWPEGFEDGMIRFIRLKHGDRAWADGMGKRGGNADENFLTWFKLKSGAKYPVAEKGEAYRAATIADNPKGQFPPFVYVTGDDDIRVSDHETELLRKYLLEEGGTLFIDLGGPRFDRSVRGWVTSRLLPGRHWKRIANDDPIYRYPFPFPDGAPAMWYHINDPTPLGIKHDEQDRWVVYFFRGDLNDAWKSVNMTAYPKRAEKAFRLGTNVIYHSITHYVRINRKYLMQQK